MGFVDLRKKAKLQLEKRGLAGSQARVGFVLDASKSMHPLYQNGVVQEVLERILALAVNLDDNQQVDMFLFGTGAVELPPARATDFEGYVTREILGKHKINQATNYAPPLRLISQKYQVGPVFIIFVTDGNNSDKADTQQILRDMSPQPIFTQFVGIGHEKFTFLEKLNDLTGRYIDNAGFMQVNDITMIEDTELYARLLNEYPDWLAVAREKGLF